MTDPNEALAREAFERAITANGISYSFAWDSRIEMYQSALTRAAFIGYLAAWSAARRDEDLAELKRLRLFRRFLETAASVDDPNEPLAVHEWIEIADEAVKQVLAFSEVKP
jgi:hypothetical protein